MSEEKSCAEFIKQLQQELGDPVHQRIVQAYSKDNSVRSMEDELSRVLVEAMNHAD